ncbi:hypothetical protein N6H18_07860 [Reichenbachiella agarivorans]|uniref:Uncharacterized protein n=1 Tax=Reichenbachiella agarivorans TaxID=2979464 RepID=A0ABY6CU50_9BACT|nr:hypothetical protein [Reichenbachiella agarivorans]UXP33859.1 hypothetical protein N6H18_07860 [Reichenbachiella agarivorans]
MYEIKADIQKNILILRLEGYMSDEEIKAGVELTISEAKKLKSGYTVINDITKMKPASPLGTEEIKRAQAFVVSNGAAKIIRIVDNPISKMQFNRTSTAAGYHALEAKTVEDALKLV